MTALSITAANVLLVSGPTAVGVGGEAFIAGAMVYYSGTKWLKAQCDGNALEAGSEDLGMALTSCDADGAPVVVAKPGAVVAVGTGAAGIVYCPGTTAGSLVPTADLASTNKVTVAAIGIGSSRLQLCRDYNAGSALA